MPKWTEYTSKNTLADNDEVMLYDATGKANKRGLMSKFWDYVVDKMSTAVISKLETKNKTVIGAINALNSDMGVKIAQYYTKDGTLTIKTNWKGAEYDRATIAVISSNGGAIVAELSKSTIISTNSTDSTVKINFSDKELTFSNLPWYSSPFFMFDSKKIDLL